LWLAGAAVLAAMALDIFFNPHYAAPIAALIMALLIQGLRQLSAGLRRRAPRYAGPSLVRSVAAAALAVFLSVGFAPRLWSRPWPGNSAYVFAQGETPRDRVIRTLSSLEGNHLVLVRHSPNAKYDAWVYNDADIDRSRIVWAHDMGDAGNEALLRYFAARRVWILDTASDPPRLFERTPIEPGFLSNAAPLPPP
jgi:hypothetical protein